MSTPTNCVVLSDESYLRYTVSALLLMACEARMFLQSLTPPAITQGRHNKHVDRTSGVHPDLTLVPPAGSQLVDLIG